MEIVWKQQSAILKILFLFSEDIFLPSPPPPPDPRKMPLGYTIKSCGVKDKSENLKASYRQSAFYKCNLGQLCCFYSQWGGKGRGLWCQSGQGEATPKRGIIVTMASSDVWLLAMTHQVDSWFSLLPVSLDSWVFYSFPFLPLSQYSQRPFCLEMAHSALPAPQPNFKPHLKFHKEFPNLSPPTFINLCPFLIS